MEAAGTVVLVIYHIHVAHDYTYDIYAEFHLHTFSFQHFHR